MPPKYKSKYGIWKPRYSHAVKRYAAAASGAALGYIHGNLPGMYYGARSAYNYVGPYQKHHGKRTGSIAYHHFRPPPKYKHAKPGQGGQIRIGTRDGPRVWVGAKFGGWKYVGGSFGIRRIKRGHRGKTLVSRKYKKNSK